MKTFEEMKAFIASVNPELVRKSNYSLSAKKFNELYEFVFKIGLADKILKENEKGKLNPAELIKFIDSYEEKFTYSGIKKESMKKLKEKNKALISMYPKRDSQTLEVCFSKELDRYMKEVFLDVIENLGRWLENNEKKAYEFVANVDIEKWFVFSKEWKIEEEKIIEVKKQQKKLDEENISLKKELAEKKEEIKDKEKEMPKKHNFFVSFFSFLKGTN